MGASSAPAITCRNTLTMLRAVATTGDDRAEPLHRIAAAIAPPSERSD
jgi:hypothetical protein